MHVGDRRLHTKLGKPLIASGDEIFDRSGRQVGLCRGNKVYGPDGQYAATVVGNVVAYRSVDATKRIEPFAPALRPRSPMPNRVASTISGEEPFLS